MSVFLLQFLMKFADRMVGKGLSIFVIAELIIYNLAWMVVLVVPMAVLIATLMAFGNLAQNNEVAVMKASGISLYKMMVPPLFASGVLVIFLIFFNNYLYPDANHAARLLMHDISRKKPTLSLVPGLFSQEIPNYSILARDIDREANVLKDMTIYDNSKPEKTNIVTAEKGRIYFSPDQSKLILDLTNGEIHETQRVNKDPYRILKFNKHRIVLPAEQFTFQQTAPGGPRGDRELGAQDIIKIVDSIKTQYVSYQEDYENKIEQYLFPDSTALNKSTRAGGQDIYASVETKISNAKNAINAAIYRMEANKKSRYRYWVEIHKKFSIPAACIVFILIGAPLGTMTRKGGFGMAGGISLLFFLIYWAFLIGGEKLADRGMLSPFIGMWSANFILGALGIWLTVKAAKERITISFDFVQRIIPKKFRKNIEEDDKVNR